MNPSHGLSWEKSGEQEGVFATLFILTGKLEMNIEQKTGQYKNQKLNKNVTVCSITLTPGLWLIIGYIDGNISSDFIYNNTLFDQTVRESMIGGGGSINVILRGIDTTTTGKLPQLKVLKIPLGVKTTLNPGIFSLLFPTKKEGYTPIAIKSWALFNRDGADNIHINGVVTDQNVSIEGKISGSNQIIIPSDAFVEVLYLVN